MLLRSTICQVSGMRPEEARDLLLKIARLEHTNDTEALATTIVKVNLSSLSSSFIAVTIVKELGHLALAVIQAGAYIFRSRCDMSVYLQLYQARRGELLEESRDYKTRWTTTNGRLHDLANSVSSG